MNNLKFKRGDIVFYRYEPNRYRIGHITGVTPRSGCDQSLAFFNVEWLYDSHYGAYKPEYRNGIFIENSYIYECSEVIDDESERLMHILAA